MLNTATGRLMFSVFIIFFSLLTAPLSLAISYADVVFIVNASVDTSTLSKKDIKEIFLGDRVSWEDGQKIRPAILKNVAVHKDFTRFYTQKSEDQFIRYWRKQLFTGKAQIPDTFESENDLVRFVKDNKGAIGYLSSVPELKGIKTITVSE